MASGSVGPAAGSRRYVIDKFRSFRIEVDNLVKNRGIRAGKHRSFGQSSDRFLVKNCRVGGQKPVRFHQKSGQISSFPLTFSTLAKYRNGWETERSECKTKSGHRAKEKPLESKAFLPRSRGSSDDQIVEAAGIEPASRGTSVPVSTCVAELCLSSALVFAFPCPVRQGRGSAIGQVV